MHSSSQTTSLREIKQTAKKNLQTQYTLPKSVGSIGLIGIKDPIKRKFVLEGISAIGMGSVVLCTEQEDIENIACVEKINQNELVGFDFFVFDNEHEGIDVVKCMKAGIVPIMPDKNVFAGMLREFNPMKFEGNGFFWSGESPYCIFQKIVSYTENIKFPEDRRVLLKNIVETF
ncbi:MAG: hypothetical protein Q8K26_03325 [Candidatus Gracilibacteria bacterium]|nr:hypothetical protein [Candidatus Gracilibacteria bacterium]